MPYLTKEEVALLTANPVRAEVVSPSILVSNIGQAATGIVNSLLTGAAGNTLDTLKPMVRSYLGRNISIAETLLAEQLSSVPDSIENLLNQDYTNIVDLLKAGIGQGVGSIHASLYESLNGTNALVQGYIGMIQRVGIDPSIQRWVNSQVHPNWFSTDTAWFLRQIGKLETKDFLKYAEAEGWDSTRADLISQSMVQPPSIGLLYEMARRKFISIADFRKWVRYYRVDESTLNAFSGLISQFPEAYRAADMYAKGFIDKPKMLSAFGAWGLGEEWAVPYSEAQYNAPAISLLFELLWRGLIDEATFNLMLTRGAVHPAVKSGILSLKDQIPPAADIITMVVREAFEADNVISAPTEFATWMLKKGYNQAWSDRYWTAHFLPIPLRQAYDNLRRGYWDETTFKNALRIADIHPRWHDAIIKVAYVPPSIRELGYGYDVGAYNKDDIIRYRRWGGLSAEDAEKAATALIDYRVDAERSSIRTLYLTEFINDQLDEKSFRDALTKLKTNPTVIDLWVQRGLIAKEVNKFTEGKTTPRVLSVTEAQWMFENGVRDKQWLSLKLKSLGFSDEDGAALIDQSTIKLGIRLKEIQKIDVKQLSISQLQDLYFADKLSKPNLQAKIQELGYTEQDAKDLTDILTTDIAAKSKKLSLSQIANLYYEGVIGNVELEERLGGIGYSTQDSSLLMELITLSVPTVKAQPTLTLSDIEQLYKFGYYDEKELIKVYSDRGYKEYDAQLKTYLTMLDVKIPMLISQYSKGWISANDLYVAIGQLSLPFTVIGIPEKRLQDIMMTIVKNNQAERVVKERDLTKAEILKGAKNHLLTPAQAVELLGDIGYDNNEANYLLALNGVIAVGDPKNYYHMKQATQAYKKIQHPDAPLIPDELVDLEETRRTLEKQIKELKGKTGNEAELGEKLVESANTIAQIATIKTKLKLK